MIKAKNIHKSYGDLEVLKGVDLEIKTGEIVSIVGESGAGKSTLLHILGTLDLPSNIDKYGTELTIGEQSFLKMNDREISKFRNENIGFVFQHHQLLPEFTALENVLMPYRIMGKKIDDKVMERANELIELVGLSKVKNNLATQMSGGQQQRTAIARSLMNNPSIILADEPTGNLDSDTTEQIYDLMRKINKKYNTTFIIITHDQHVAEKTDRIIEVKDGRIIMDVRRNND